MFNVTAFISSLGIMIEGWLGIFIVMGVIIAVVHGLNKFGAELEKKMSDKQ